MANNFKNPWEQNQWAQGGEEYKKSAVGTEYLPKDAAYFTGINPNTGESIYQQGNNNFDNATNDPVAQKLNLFASSFRNVLSRMYSKSVLTNNTKENIEKGIPLKEVREYGHHFIRTQEGGYREYEENGEYPGTIVASPQIYTIIKLNSYGTINNKFVRKGESYEIEVHTHPTFDSLVIGYEHSRNLAPSGEDIAYFPKFKDYILFVEAESIQYALVVINEKKSRQKLGIAKAQKLLEEYKKTLNEPSESSMEASINAVKNVLGQAKDCGVAFYINWDKANPNFTKQN